MKAKIKDAEIKDPYDLWKRKPRNMTMNDTDVIVVRMETEQGEEIKKTFYTSLNSNKEFSLDAPSRESELRRRELADFIEKYIDPENPRKVETEKWEGKKVKVKDNKVVM